MKMEVLSVQNQFQGQFGVIGSTKVKDWTSPLTSPPHHLQHHLHRQQHHHRNNHHHQNNRHHHSNTHYSCSNVKPTAAAAAAGKEVIAEENNLGVDVVDGFTPIVDGHFHGPHATQQQLQQQLQHHSNEQYYHYHHHHQSVGAAASSGKVIDDDDAVVDASSTLDYQTPPTLSPSSPLSPTPAHYNISRYNSNLICCGAGGTAAGGAGVGGGGNITGIGIDVNVNVDAVAINELSMRLQSELRAAKSRHLACTEVSLPWDLTPRIAAEIIRLSEKEPCGIRGCTIYIEFEDEPTNTRRIASLKIDPNTVSTFELYLTLKHDKSGWTSLLPQFIKNLTRSSSIIISPDFSLTKNKLYHSSSE